MGLTNKYVVWELSKPYRDGKQGFYLVTRYSFLHSLLLNKIFILFCDCFCGTTSLWSDIDSGTHFFRNVKKADLTTAQTSFNFSQNLRVCRCGPWTYEFHLLTTFGDVFWGGRSQHSSDMFERLTQKSSVVETIKKPTPRRQRAYADRTREGR